MSVVGVRSERPVVLITGAAGGIGSATARVFATAGWVVVGVDRRGAEVVGVDRMMEADIADPSAPERVFERVWREYRRLDAVVNNAAVQVCKPIVETTLEDWDLVMASNLRSVFLSMRYAFSMLRETRGSIVNVSSVHAVATSKNIAAYAASKGALLAFTRATALEFGEHGVRVNAVLPGAVDTQMLHAGLDRGHVEGDSVDALVRGLGRKHVLGRVGRPEEIGELILFLADGRRSGFITGQAIVADGGALARLSTE
jgi:NAD(P)-dependent dehydrogenase (short-subunit alcohol dehydrogenase family)